MQFQLTHLMIGLTIIAIQMSDSTFARIGISCSLAVLGASTVVLAYYSVRKFTPANPVPRLAEIVLGYAFLNLAITTAFTFIKQILDQAS